MNIAFLTKEYNTSTVDAGFTTLITLAKEFKQKGHKVIMISGRQTYKKGDILPAQKRFEIFEGISIFRPYHLPWFRVNKWFFDPSNMFNKILAAPLGLRYVEKRLNIKFNIIHSFSSSPVRALSSYLAGFFSKEAVLIHSMKSFSEFINARFQFINSFLCRTLNLCDIVTVPLFSIKMILTKNGCREEKIRVINSPIDLHQFINKNKCDKQKLRKKYGLGINNKIVLYYGNRVDSKGVDILIDSSNYFLRDPNIKLYFIFPTEGDKKSTDLINSKKNKNITVLIGKINVVEYLNIADILVLPYKHLKNTEANPLCLLEAMACKTPIITTSLPEIKELVQDGRDVIMAKPNNSIDLANKIMFLLNNSKIQKRQVMNASKIVKKFDKTIIADKYLRLYHELLNKKRGINDIYF